MPENQLFIFICSLVPGVGDQYLLFTKLARDNLRDGYETLSQPSLILFQNINGSERSYTAVMRADVLIQGVDGIIREF